MPDRPPLPEQAASQMPKREEPPESSGGFPRLARKEPRCYTEGTCTPPWES